MRYSSQFNLPEIRHSYTSAIVRSADPGRFKKYSAEQILQPPCSNPENLQVLLSGFSKTSIVNEMGDEDILGFSMPGDVLGLSALAPLSMSCQIVFLTDALIAELPLDEAMRLEVLVGGLGHGLCDLISRELLRTQWRNRYVRCACVTTRVAQFLLEIGRRYAEIDFPSHKYRLFMPREDIAAFLGMTRCTLSRTLQMLGKRRMIDIDGRWIEIIDPVGLDKLD